VKSIIHTFVCLTPFDVIPYCFVLRLVQTARIFILAANWSYYWRVKQTPFMVCRNGDWPRENLLQHPCHIRCTIGWKTGASISCWELL